MQAFVRLVIKPYIFHVVTLNRLIEKDVHEGGLLSILLKDLHYEPLVKMISDSFCSKAI